MLVSRRLKRPYEKNTKSYDIKYTERLDLLLCCIVYRIAGEDSRRQACIDRVHTYIVSRARSSFRRDSPKNAYTGYVNGDLAFCLLCTFFLPKQIWEYDKRVSTRGAR